MISRAVPRSLAGRRSDACGRHERGLVLGAVGLVAMPLAPVSATVSLD
jgi:hypothetical protein